jgi:hypothetical protein
MLAEAQEGKNCHIPAFARPVHQLPVAINNSM